MRAVVQRVKHAQVKIEDAIVGEIGVGLLVLLGVGAEDSQADADYLVKKIVELRIFEDEQGKMNLSLGDIGGEMLVVSQFTLYGDCRKGRRPSYSEAAPPEAANALYEYFVAEARTLCKKVATGQFQAMMDVVLSNNGPVTLLLDSKKVF
jgi:D-tyrosyl-tRNA(Tyr) deacylase